MLRTGFLLALTAISTLGASAASTAPPRAAAGSPSAPLPAGSSPSPAVALVCRVEGGATWRRSPGAPPEPVGLFLRLPAGAVLAAGRRSTVVVVFFDGQRYALEGRAQAVVETAGLRPTAGRVHRLAAVPAVVELAPLLRDGSPRRRASAVRIRGETGPAPALAGLDPSAGAAVPRQEAVLSFLPVAGIDRYRVTVADERGGPLFAAEVQSPPVQVPADRLRPGAVYSWRVEGERAPRPGEPAPPEPSNLRADAVFRTLDEGVESSRGALEAAVRGSGQPDLALLLAEVDRCLDLRRQACEELGAAIGGAAAGRLEPFECPRPVPDPAADPVLGPAPKAGQHR